MCPEPVLAAKKMLDDPEVQSVSCIVDDEVNVQNLERLAVYFKASAKVKKEQGFFVVEINRKTLAGVNETSMPSAAVLNAPEKGMPAGGGTIIFIAKDSFGEGEHEFSRLL